MPSSLHAFLFDLISRFKQPTPTLTFSFTLIFALFHIAYPIEAHDMHSIALTETVSPQLSLVD